MTSFPGQTRIPEKASYSIHGACNTAFRFANLPSRSPNIMQISSFNIQTIVSPTGKSVTTLLRTIRPNKEDRVAKFEWAANGGLGRVVIGKVCLILSLAVLEADSKLINQNMLPMADMVRPDPTVQVRHLLRMHVYNVTNVSRGRPRFQRTGRSFVPVETKRHQF